MYACGGYTASFLYPILIMVSSLSKDELPNDEFVVVPIESLSINGHIYPRNKEVGYMWLISANVAQIVVVDWFNENVTYPTIKCIRKLFNPLSAGDAQEGQIPMDQQYVCKVIVI